MNKYKLNIKKNYGFVFMRSLNFSHGIWMIYLYSKGLTLVELGMLESIFHITSFIMETPTGAIADIYGRKTSRLLGLVMNVIYLLIIINTDAFVWMAIGFVFCGLSYNLESGADSAMIYDSLKHTGDESKNMKVNGINEVLYQSASAISLFIGGWLALRSFELNYLVTIGSMIVAFLIMLSMKETTIQKREENHKSVLDVIVNQYKVTIDVIKGEKRIVFLIVFLNVLGVIVTTSFFFMQNFWKSYGFSEAYIGTFLALQSVFGAFGGYMAHKIEKRFKEIFILKGLPVLLVGFTFLLSFQYLSIIGMAIIAFLEAVAYVVITDYIHRIIPSEQRATILSFSSTVFSLLMIVVFPLFGYIGDTFSLNIAFISLSLTALVLLLGYLFNFRSENNA